MTESVLDTIIAGARARVAAARAEVPLPALRAAVGRRERSTRVLDRFLEGPAIIAEVKRGSPSRGRFSPDVSPVPLARAYAEGGADVISVVTDEEHFFALPGMFGDVRGAVDVPLLAKDFFIDPYQLYAAALDGADLVLLIVAALDDAALAELLALSTELGLEALVETHDEREVDRAVAAGARIIGINNRNLHTFEVDLAVTERLAPRVVGGRAVVAESGLNGPETLVRLWRAGAHAFLIGESLVTHPDPSGRLLELRAALEKERS